MSSEDFKYTSDMPKGPSSSSSSSPPSPIVPLLLVVGLGLLLRGSSSSITTLNLPLVSDGENAVFTCLVFIPVLVLLAVYSTTHTILMPLALILVTYTVTTMLLGPLVLILMVYLGGAYLASVKCDGEELGWGCMLVLGFFLLHWVMSKEGRQSGALVVAIMLFLCYHCFP